MSELKIDPLLQTNTVALRDVCCTGACRHRGTEE
jgi:hypothetical protein